MQVIIKGLSQHVDIILNRNSKLVYEALLLCWCLVICLGFQKLFIYASRSLSLIDSLDSVYA